MAAASGQPQDDSTAKPGLSPDKKKLYGILAVVGVVVLLGGAGYFVPKMMSGGSSSDTTTTTSNTVAQSPDGTTPGSVTGDGTGVPGVPGAQGMPGAPGAVAGATTGTLVSSPPMRSRPDPFQEAYLIPTPVPLPPPPVEVPGLPDEDLVSLPGSNVKFADMQQPLNLPAVRIDRLDETTRRPVDAFPPRRTTSESGTGSVSPSFDKRLSGVVIGDGVRALLEIQGPNGIVTRNVQPGDEVDGITVLNIQRYLEGGRTVTRMLIRENGEERSVELKASPAPPASQLGASGIPGAPGIPGMPGMPGNFPGASPFTP
ncbi:hypothetical protein EON80_07575 [bacterium]|nr:MAG: hypothetical protein EON80_07575 [bacterium]